MALTNALSADVRAQVTTLVTPWRGSEEEYTRRDRPKTLRKSRGDAMPSYVKAALRLIHPEVWCCSGSCLLYTSDAADEEDSVDLGGRRII